MYTMATDCTTCTTCNDNWAISTANLVGTPIKFSSSLSYQAGGANNAVGDSVLSSNNQILTVRTKGRCANTYFALLNGDWHLQFGDNHPVLGEHLIPVAFV